MGDQPSPASVRLRVFGVKACGRSSRPRSRTEADRMISAGPSVGGRWRIGRRRCYRRGVDRRHFLLTVMTGAVAVPLAVEAQQTEKVWRIGLFHVGLDHIPPSLDGIRAGLKALGYVEGRNVHLDFRNLF